jgi:transcriptional regulator NrdR family protein
MFIANGGDCVTKVIKKDKKKEAFDAEKLRKSIEAAARDSEISEERAKEVTGRVAKTVIERAEKEKEIGTQSIREMILKELDSAEPAVSEAWRNYDKNRRRIENN